jgi:hypothetical protein
MGSRKSLKVPAGLRGATHMNPKYKVLKKASATSPYTLQMFSIVEFGDAEARDMEKVAEGDEQHCIDFVLGKVHESKP